MSTRLNLLKLLEENSDSYISGQRIGEELQVSRNAIWKAITQLKNDGYNIESKPSVGYCLKQQSNILTKNAIESHLHHLVDLTLFDTIDSTNNQAKLAVIKDKPLVFVSNKQTAGRGRLGRSFVSPGGSGLYLSIAVRPDFDLDKSLYVTMACAVAVCRALETVASARGKIKWVNDVFVDNKKVCGILTEAQTNFETGKIDSLIMGIGINCFPGNFPEELSEIVGSVSQSKNAFSRSLLAAEIINETLDILEDLTSKAFLREYKAKCFILGKQIMIHPNLNDTAIKARAIDIDDNGGLVVEYMEGLKARQMETLTTGEISIRPID